MTQGSFNQILEGLTLLRQGKVRDIYEVGDYLLMVATDRISAFDVVMDQSIPVKGVFLNEISNAWFKRMESIVKNHLKETDPDLFPKECYPHKKALAGRSVLVKKTKPSPVECIVRGHISGSGWKSYQKDGTVCGIKLPAGLVESEQLPQPIFTPSTKAPDGEHDLNISFDEMVKIVGGETAEILRDLSLKIYTKGAQIAQNRGIIIADTKFEFGVDEEGEIILIDEVLTPDSSRFWPEDQYRPGGPQPSFDKQFLRDYLISLDWDKTPPPPPLPEKIITKTQVKYAQAHQVLTN